MKNDWTKLTDEEQAVVRLFRSPGKSPQAISDGCGQYGKRLIPYMLEQGITLRKLAWVADKLLHHDDWRAMGLGLQVCLKLYQAYGVMPRLSLEDSQNVTNQFTALIVQGATSAERLKLVTGDFRDICAAGGIEPAAHGDPGGRRGLHPISLECGPSEDIEGNGGTGGDGPANSNGRP